MKVTLNIENDSELRTHIKECIKGQVLSIVREEFLEIIKNELERKIKGTNDYNWNALLKSAFKEAINDILYKEHSVGSWNIDFIKPFVESKVSEAIKGKDWKQMIDSLAKEKVKALIQ